MTTDETPHPAPARPAPATVEESRLSVPLTAGGTPLATRVLEASGFDRLVDDFLERIRRAGSLVDLSVAVREAGPQLWQRAVDRAQGRSVDGDLDPYDDRPLYWARTSMAAALRRLDSPHLETQHQRLGLLRILDRTSRGIERTPWPESGAGEVRVMLSGFDVFGLDDSVRHSNPSGAAALQLDGARLSTAHGVAHVRAVVLPVSYADFDQGVVEDAFGPVLLPGPDRADLIMTITMTSRGL